MTDHVLLVGMMGSGKTTVGHLLAGRLGWPYRDSDQQVQEETGQTVPEIFASRGEAAFRAEEAAVLADAVQRQGPTVVGVAGGAVLDPVNR
ncbi:MAG TPA: shikimate kinase, partial [Acidimicrobiales bacterium]|nr:shikimate kinase [Acidimicrobiales bacterium]